MKITKRYIASITILLMAMYGTAFAQTPDTEAPSIPTGLVATEISSQYITISWEPSTDNVEVAGYKVFINGNYTDDTYNEGIDYESPEINTEYIFQVSAFDAASNESPKSEELIVSTAGSASVIGVLREGPDGVPQGYGRVYLQGAEGRIEQAPDEDGSFVFFGMEPGEYTLTGSLEPYTDPPEYTFTIASGQEIIQDVWFDSPVPIVNTYPVSNITSSSVTSGGDIVDPGYSSVLSKGVCWSTMSHPVYAPDTTFDGVGMGSYTSEVVGLEPNTTYYLRAYARNENGVGYGEEFQFVTTCPDISLTPTVTDVTCNGESDGSITLAHLSTGEPYSYEWSGPSEYSASTKDISSLLAGDYTVIISGAGDCSWEGNYTISEPSAIQITVDYISNESGLGIADGAIEITTFGGSPIYTYSWTGPNDFTSTDEDISGLATGTYTVVVTDQNSCSVSLDVDVGNPLIVTNTSDYNPYGGGDVAGEAPIPGTLRYAMEYANDHTGPDNISFNIPGEGPHKISPVVLLPTITESVTIDGYTQEGAIKATSSTTANIMIELDGSNLPDNQPNYGLVLETGNCVIRGLMINRFRDVGIEIAPPGGNIIEGNYIGSDGSGNTDMGNGYGEPDEEGAGIRIYRSSGNIIGGSNEGARNIISNNTKYGILINGSVNNGTIYPAVNNQILGNLVGTDKSGTIDIGNEVGIQIDTASMNTIGGLITTERNIISGNNTGIIIGGQNASENSILGNYIGTDITGANALGNNWAIYVYSGGNYIGGTDPGAGNVISGNVSSALLIVSSMISEVEASDNKVWGNYIGPNASGTGAVSNSQVGLMIVDASSNTIGGSSINERNVISGNRKGIYIGWQGAFGNYIQGNIVGLTVDGSTKLANSEEGIFINAPGNYIGGTEQGEGNIISGNSIGILLSDTADGNFIQGNLIGTDITGITSLANTTHGIDILGGKDNIIGGASKSARNVISGNDENGIYMHFSTHGDTATGNIVKGNFIGLNIEGSKLGNGNDGIRVDTRNNFIGGNNPGEGNVISGNGSNGVHIWEKEAVGNQILGNIIGLDSTGTIDIGNASGVALNTCIGNTLGGTESGSRNIISGNEIGVVIQGPEDRAEPRLNRVLGNYIGTDIKGTEAIGNTQGIFIGGALENTIGGSSAAERNIISGNESFGILLIEASHDNQVRGNFIGTDVTGTKAIPNFIGVHILGSERNTIGGPEYGDGNLISGNTEGVLVYGNGDYTANENIFQGNFIGTDISGQKPLGNNNGIRFQDWANRNLVGGTEPGEGNLIAYNQAGIVCNGPWFPSVGNSFLSNSIHSNTEIGINLYNDVPDLVTPNDASDYDSGSNEFQNFPVLDTVTFLQDEVTIAGSLNSLPGQDFLLQFFVSPEADETGYGEGKTFIGSDTVTVNPSGYTNFHLTYPTSLRDGLVVTATATDTAGNTSEFSNAIGGAQNQQATGTNMPMHWVINEEGVPYVNDSSDFLALHQAFDTWAAIPSSEVDFIYDGPTSQAKAVANDGINLITFMDETYFTTQEVLGLAAKTLMMDDVSGIAEIVDADIVFNPYFTQGESRFATDTYPGLYDLQSIATHEIGHTFGMIHAGVLEATMFFSVMENSTEKRTLEEDDKAWASYRYQKQPEYDLAYGSILGNITYGDDPQFPPVGGALVIATNTSTGDAIHSYSDENGDYMIPVPAGNYTLAIQPLDGNVHGYNLTQSNISYYIDAITIYTDFPNESWNGTSEGAVNDDPDEATGFMVAAGSSAMNIDLVTNKDETQPYIMAVTPKRDSVGVSVMTQVFMGFSEQVDINTFTDETCYLTSDKGEVYGHFVVADNYGRRIAFTPKEYPLDFSLLYTLHLTSGITDLKGNGLDIPADPYTFTTEDQDTVAPYVTDMIPDDGSNTVFTNANIMVFFSKAMDASTTPDGFSVTYDGGQMVQGIYSWDEDLKILTFDPNSFLDEGTEYTVSVTKGLKDLSQNPLKKDSMLVFTTVPEANPEIIFVGPGPNQESVSLDSPLLIDFTEPIDPQTANANTIKLLLNNAQLNGKFEFLYSNSRVVFRPDQLLLPNTTYDVLVEAGQISDVSDPKLFLDQGVSHQFTTAATVEEPFIKDLHPSSGAVGTMVTISGGGIDPNPNNVKVMFGDKEASILYNETSYLTTRVPAGAKEGMVTIEVNGKLSNEEYFYVVPINDYPGDDIRRVVGTQAQAEDVEIEPDAAYAYITNSGANVITRLNMITFQTQSLAVGQMPVQIDIHPNGDMAYVSNHLSHDVSVIDLDLMQVVETIAVGINPYGLVVSPSGDLLFVANTTSEDVLYIDVDPYSGGYDKVVRSVKTSASNTGIDVSPDQALVLIACEQGILFLITDQNDPAFNTINRTVNTSAGASGVQILPDAGLAVAATDDNYLVVIGIIPGVNYAKIVGKVNTRGSIGDIDINPDGQLIYVTHPLTDEVSVYQIEYTGAPNADASVNVSVNLELINVIEVDKAPYSVAVDPKGEKVLVGHYTSDGQVTEIDTRLDVIATLEQLIESVTEAMDDELINIKYGGKLLVDLEKTLARYENDQLESAIDHLDNFIIRLERWIKDGQISEGIGSTWLEAAYRIREQLLIKFEEMGGLKGSAGSAGLDIGSNTNQQNIQSHKELIGEREIKLQNQPNPFSHQTRINFEIPEIGRADIPVVMRVFNTNGQVVRTLVHMNMEPGLYSVNWSGSLDDGGLVPDGIYLLELSIPGQREVLTISIIR